MNIVAHNILAMNAQRMYGINTNSKKKSTEKLSSGYKINRAADDAAGLSISEKMRRQIRGLKQGSDNLHDGISFVQTADGYLEEVQDMLQRMNELSIKAANGTNSASDRNDIDNEIQELKQETKRIFKTAKFNETIIFDMPYVPSPEIHPEYRPGTAILKKVSDSFPPGAKLDSVTAASGQMTNSYTSSNGHTYKSACFIDFSGVDFSNIASLDGTGFYSTCCTCDDMKYGITFDSTTNEHTRTGNGNFLYTVGTKDCTSASDLASRIYYATMSGGRKADHYTDFEVDKDNANRLVIHDNREDQTPYGDFGRVYSGVIKEVTPVNAGEEIQVFSSGLNADGSVKYGGIELNDVRHTWEELGVSVSEDGRTFTASAKVDFKDYKGERVVLNINAGDPANELSRTNYWHADEQGVYIDDIFAASWEDIGIKDTDNTGEYSVLWRQQEIWFTVNDGDSKRDVIDGINTKVLDVPYSWDIMASDRVDSAALNLYGINSLRVTENNKAALDAEYGISADSEGITITSTDGVSHTKTEWKDFVNTGSGDPYPISDWGLDDKDGKGKASDLVTFDDTAYYRYVNTAQTDLGIGFSFNLRDESGMDQAIAALDGVTLSKAFTAPNTLSTSSGNSKNGAKPAVSLSEWSLTYDVQKAYGRDFNEQHATLDGTINRTVKENIEKSSSTVYSPESRIQTTTASSSNTSTVYVKGSDGLYHKYNKNVSVYDDTMKRKETITKTYDAQYNYSGSFAGENVVDTDGSKFEYIKTTVNDQEGISQRTLTLFTKDSAGLTEDELNRLGKNEYDKLTGLTETELNVLGVDASDRLAAATDSTSYGPAAGWSTKSTKDTYVSKANDTVTLTSAKGNIGNLTMKDATANSFGEATANVSFKASDYATCAFSGKANSEGNKNVATRFHDVKLNVPPRKLDIQYDCDNPDYIGIEWMGLNNTIIGIHSANTKTMESSRKAIDQVGRAIKYVSDTRSLFGAQQNRLEHAVKINDNTAENTQAAESIIRDTDMEKELVHHSIISIMMQAGEAMMTQANQSNQGVLSLIA